jgi:hypothetical protein
MGCLMGDGIRYVWCPETNAAVPEEDTAPTTRTPLAPLSVESSWCNPGINLESDIPGLQYCTWSTAWCMSTP